MKNFTTLFLATVGLALFVSCDKESEKETVPEETPASLEGTHWVGRSEWKWENEEYWIEEELKFHATTVTWTTRRKDLSYGLVTVAPYTFTVPHFKIVLKNEIPPPADPDKWYVSELICNGTIVDDSTMTFEAMETFDIFRTVTMKRQ